MSFASLYLNITGVFAFIGLGVVMLTFAWAYEKIVYRFKKRRLLFDLECRLNQHIGNIKEEPSPKGDESTCLAMSDVYSAINRAIAESK